MGRTYSGLGRLWRPGGERLELIAEVLSQRWRAAAKLTPTRLFWQSPGRWLKPDAQPHRVEARPHHFTTGGRLIR
jgi:hypothetical protein